MLIQIHGFHFARPTCSPPLAEGRVPRRHPPVAAYRREAAQVHRLGPDWQGFSMENGRGGSPMRIDSRRENPGRMARLAMGIGSLRETGSPATAADSLERSQGSATAGGRLPLRLGALASLR